MLALLALMLLQDSRREERTDQQGEIVLLENQDRSRWDADAISEGLDLVRRANQLGGDGPYFLQASIAGQHSTASTWGSTDWSEIVSLYDRLLPITASPVVALNRAVALAHSSGPVAGLEATEGLEEDLDGYHIYHASRGEMLRRAGRLEEAREEFERAVELAGNPAEENLLLKRLQDL